METMHTHASQLFDAHMQAELSADLNATMETMVANPHLINLGSGSGGVGQEGVRKFYAEQLIGQFFPPDAEFVPISRTIDGERLVDEVVIKFTHTQKIGHLLPSVEPTPTQTVVRPSAVVPRKGPNTRAEINQEPCVPAHNSGSSCTM